MNAPVFDWRNRPNLIKLNLIVREVVIHCGYFVPLLRCLDVALATAKAVEQFCGVHFDVTCFETNTVSCRFCANELLNLSVIYDNLGLYDGVQSVQLCVTKPTLLWVCN